MPECICSPELFKSIQPAKRGKQRCGRIAVFTSAKTVYKDKK